MERKSATFTIRALLIALIAVTISHTIRGDDDDTAKFPRQTSTVRSVPEPIVVAQGRCFNGRCF
jgi:hypothetical protein